MIVQQIREKKSQHYFQSLLMQLICLAVRVEQHAYILDGCEEGQHVQYTMMPNPQQNRQ